MQTSGVGWAEAPLGGYSGTLLAGGHRDPAPRVPGWCRVPQPEACHNQCLYSRSSAQGLRPGQPEMQVLDQWEKGR